MSDHHPQTLDHQGVDLKFSSSTSPSPSSLAAPPELPQRGKKRQRFSSSSTSFDVLASTIPTFDLASADATNGNANDNENMKILQSLRQDILKAFQDYHVVLLRGYGSSSGPAKREAKGQQKENEESTLEWQDLQQVFQNLNAKDQESFCMETADSTVATTSSLSPSSSSSSTTPTSTACDFLQPRVTTTDKAAYCSFLVQHDTDGLAKLLQRVPVKTILEPQTDENHKAMSEWPSSSSLSSSLLSSSLSSSSQAKLDHEPCVWIFFGRNQNGNDTDVPGRPEHTDSISHDGTWHYQLSGTKRWFLRPTSKLLEHFQQRCIAGVNPTKLGSTKIPIACHKGDVLIVNTRLWYHQTVIPPQPNPSVSYARDFWLTCCNTAKDTLPAAAATTATTMSNLDGLYATDDIEEGTVIFREDTMPDCELHRSATNANCEVVEMNDENGEIIQAVVSSRKISAGEFFCIPESDDERSEDDDGDKAEFEEVDDDDDDDDEEEEEEEEEDNDE